MRYRSLSKTQLIGASIAQVALLLVASISSGFAQAPLGSAKSDSAITLQGSGGFVTLDLTKQQDKTQPVVRLAYQSESMSDQVKQERAANPSQELHRIPNYGLELTGTPSGDSASLFGGGTPSNNATVNITFGQSYLLSYVRPRSSAVYSNEISRLRQFADLISKAKDTLVSDHIQLTLNDLQVAPAAADDNLAAAKTTLAAAKLKTPPDPSEVADDQIRVDKAQSIFTLTNSIAEAQKQQTFLSGQIKSAKNEGLADLFTTALAYADDVLAYARDVGDTLMEPMEPAPAESARRLIYDAWYGRLGYGRSSHTLFDASKPFASQFQSRDSDSYSLQLGYNANFGGTLPVIIGFSGGFAKTDNADQLHSMDVMQVQTFTSADGLTQRTTTTKRSALVGAYKELTAGTGKFDVVLYPDLANASQQGKKPRASIAVDLFGRAQGGSPFVYGVGAYLTQPGSPQKIYGGLNIYRGQDDKLAIDIVSGYNF